MPSITFRRSANVFINMGIVAFERYARQYLDDRAKEFPTIQLGELTDLDLTVEGDQVFDFLTEVYYAMGDQVYDTVTTKQLENRGNLYFDKEQDKFELFPKMNTYGLTQLLTNNAQGITRSEVDTTTVKKLQKEDPALFERFKIAFEERKLKMLSKLYFQPYTKLTRLKSPTDKHFQPGKHVCSLTGEGYARLVDPTNISPFIAGISTFNSHLSAVDRPVSWSAMYLTRFSPAMALYSYHDSYEMLVCHFVNSDTLRGIRDYYEKYKSIFRPSREMMDRSFQSNYRLARFSEAGGGEEENKESRDFMLPAEIAFALLFTLYMEFIRKYQSYAELSDAAKQRLKFLQRGNQRQSISLITFRADKFASTMRPSSYEEFTRVKFIMQLFIQMDQAGIALRRILVSLKFPVKKALQSQEYQKRASAERALRNNVLYKVLNAQPILNEIEELYFRCYKRLASTDKDSVGIKFFQDTTEFLWLYDRAISNQSQYMNQALKERAIKLGKSIGHQVLNHAEGEGEKKTHRERARSGRKYIIGLQKARTLEQFNDAIIRLQNKYQITVAGDILTEITKENVTLVKQFIIISALNMINRAINENKIDNEA